MVKPSETNRLVTLDHAVSRAEASGLPMCNKRWWKRQIAAGKVPATEGAVTYVAEGVVEALLEAVKEAARYERLPGESYIEIADEVIKDKELRPSRVLKGLRGKGRRNHAA